MKNTSGIYQIQSKIHPERIYIGSAINFRKRWNTHWHDLRNNKHSSSKLQRHYNKHGKEDLVFSILHECEKGNLIKTEQFYLDKYNPWFNICKIAGNTLGREVSKKTREKISMSKKGKKGRFISEEERMQIRERQLGAKSHLYGKPGTRLGKKASDETRKKQSLAKQRMSDETKAKIADSRRGKPLSEETKRKLSKALSGEKNPMYGVTSPLKGKHHTEDAKRKIRESKLGKPLSQETKEKISIANRKKLGDAA